MESDFSAESMYVHVVFLRIKLIDTEPNVAHVNIKDKQ